MVGLRCLNLSGKHCLITFHEKLTICRRRFYVLYRSFSKLLPHVPSKHMLAPINYIASPQFFIDDCQLRHSHTLA